tara:strand:+ start:71 stop:319 length:249 start_codon:yes stop_codon:yes gene_type:complete
MKSVFAILALIASTSAIQIESEGVPAYADPEQGGDPFMNKVLNSFSEKDAKTGRYWTSRDQALELSKQTMIEGLKQLPYWAQ